MNLYISHFLGVSKNQDYADHADNGLVICDGIGSMQDSGVIARKVVETFIEQFLSEESFEDQELVNKITRHVKDSSLTGGTTLIYGRELSDQKFRVGYLGNGGLIHFRGDFYYERIGETISHYSNLIIPHVDRIGALTKHISSDSTEKSIQLSTLDLTLNSEKGDLLLFYSDGIGSLETQFVADMEDDGLWRIELELIQDLLLSLHEELIKPVEIENRKEQLINMLKIKCGELKKLGRFEDDVSIGLVITDKVFDYYHSKTNPND
ncbi:MAG: protein phosphatase 2C domain-containing protein [Bacteroidota bacterium]